MKFFFKKIIRTILMLLFFQPFAVAKNNNAEDVYGFSFVNLVDESKINLADYKGKVLLIVNTASKCGFTSQYEGLENLHQKYQNRGLVIIGVPSDNFGGQEFANNHEIHRFCKYNFGVSFLMSQKENIIGKNSHPFYAFAKEKLGIIASPKWNFHKYLINRHGKLIDYFVSSTKPDNKELIKSIENELDNIL